MSEPKLVTKLFIDGQFVDAVSKKTFPTVNPATKKEITQVAEADAADVDIAVAAARKAFAKWRHVDGYVKRDCLLKLADLLEKNKEELARIECMDNGKPYAQALNVDMALGVLCLRYYAGFADKISGKTNPVEGNFFSYTKHQAVGVVGQIIPWNFPLLMAIWKIGPAMATGCCVVMKPAEQTPLSILRFAEFFNEAGFPPGVLNILTGYGPTAGAAIAKHNNVDKVAFTGSTEVGHIIMKLAAESNLKKVSLELGGKSPLVICEDADLDAAVETAANGVFFNQGQVCTASSRLFVQESIHDEVVKRLVEKAKARKQGDGNQDVDLGPQVSQEQQDTVCRYIDLGRKAGATVAAGGEKGPECGYFVQPTVFTGVTDDMAIAKEEIFGPVMSVLKFKTLDEAILRANDSTYGLAAGIFTRDINKAFRYANEVDAGTVWVNTYNAFSTAQPFGGFKQSGIGRELGEYALSLYTEVKTVMFALDHSPVRN